MPSIEQTVLIRSSSLSLKPEDLQEVRRLVAAVMDKEHLIRVAVREGLAGFLYKALKRSDTLDALNEEQRRTLQGLYHATARRNMLLIKDLKNILRESNQVGVSVVLLQGMALLQAVYRDIGLRPMVDIDLWVLKDHYPGFVGVLDKLGYARDPLYPHTFRRGATTLDVHTHLFWADRIKSRELLVSRSQDHIYRDTEIIDFEADRVRCLSKYDQVLYLGLHALKHHVAELLWLVDIRNLVEHWESSEWQGVMDRARDLGLERTLAHILYLLHRILNFDHDSEMTRFMARRGPDILERAALRGRIKGMSLPAWASLILFIPQKGWGKRLRYLLETAFPRPEILRQVFAGYPHLKTWQLYLMRLFQLMARALLLPLKGG